ncbi:Multicopper oxidase with three cupredoxin domains (includes cell division protein FtsP and spore coat protein CotA) [Micromonospora viridifaciens]|uniref:Multicopper oxidase with three cupredoxin domains (Includes cell division protein FtsP and spore coat protein CotA) n=1 Tax=Micromonospora viridifaciens TaxID=1881 RepID=A0A1C4X4I7_MICVI|nr:multicopper oxidase family protein [Micromonospora viridifaciens]SCF03409.1 Multicopper oxidase with three cupredoxin domains (includes cell division protein FtsP and spore coat protein CotA) [Micromonospora viridifaciens]
MNTSLLIVLDHVVALLGVAAWSGAGVTLALRRTRPALAVLVAAVLVALARVVSVSVLAGRGWWFVQEKVLLGLPMLGVAGAVAVLLVGPRLLAAWRGRGDGASVGGVVSVFTAAYAALAGLVVTFLVGYPLTVSKALITISLVGAGALLTARVLAPAAEETADAGVALALEGRPISRRRFLGWTGGAAVVTAAGAGTGLSFLPTESVATGGGPGRTSRAAVSVADLRGSGSPAPGGTVQRQLLTAKKATVRLASGREIDAWTYNGEVPGPAITATRGDLIEVRLRNADIDDGVSLHWHGYDVPCGEDGVPGLTQPAVRPGEEFVYRFRADQVGTYWYHTHYASHVGVRKGLYGTLVVKPRDGQRADSPAAAEQVDLTLPVHTFAGAVVIAGRDGRTEHPAPPGAPVRLRLINTDSNPHRIVLAGTPFRVAAVDGRDLNQPGEVRDVALHLPAGGRYDLVFRMPDTPVALVVDGDREGGLRLVPAGGAPAEARIEDTAGLPELDLLRYGAPAALPFDPRRADRRFTMVLDRGVAMVDGRPAYAQTVNGRGHPSIPDQLVAEGDIVQFTVVNRSLETHPWHLHGHPVLILSRDGTPSTGSPLWVDTFDVRPGETWKVAFRATNPGLWMNHCHNLPHADQGMMLQLRYDGVTTPFGGSHGGSSSHGH